MKVDSMDDMPLQEPPFAIQIEPTEGCTLACSFCGLQDIRDNGADWQAGVHGKGVGPYKFMTLKTATEIAKAIARAEWNPRIEFAMHGEPSLNPALPSIISTFRTLLPNVSLMVTTNGSGVMSMDKMHQLFQAGLNTLVIDDYKHADFVAKVRQRLATEACNDLKLLPQYEYPAEKHIVNANPHMRYSGQRIVFVQDISDNDTGNHQLTNQGGSSGTAEPLDQRCAKPFRELSFRWDGNVALCCDDWKGVYKIGALPDFGYDIVKLWNARAFQAARVALYHKQRGALQPCKNCNVRTYRNGLLPDKYGKQQMPSIDDEVRTEIKRATRGQVFSVKLATTTKK